MFVFNKDYEDMEQVAPFLDEFNRVYDEVKRGSFAYNADFEGQIPGIAGPDEGRAIYMLQNLRRQRENEARVAAMLADGYALVEHLDAVTKFACVALMPHEGYVGTGPITEFTDASRAEHGDRSARVHPAEGEADVRDTDVWRCRLREVDSAAVTTTATRGGAACRHQAR